MLKNLGCIFLVLACGGSEEKSQVDAKTGPDTIALEDFADAMLTSFCQGYEGCGYYESVDDCIVALASDIKGSVEPVVALVKQDKITYDAIKAAQCLATPITSCSASVQATRVEQAANCEGIFVGHAAPGEACFIGEECTSAQCDNPDCAEACCPGVCVDVPPPAAIGESCVATICQTGAFCEESNSEPGIAFCAAQVPAGAECVSFSACQEPASCSQVGDIRVCQTPALFGKPCNPESFNPCDEASNYCNVSTGTCQLGKIPGEPCSEEVRCQDYAVCKSGTCVKRGLEGDSCDPTERSCLVGDCENGICTLEPFEPCVIE